LSDSLLILLDRINGERLSTNCDLDEVISFDFNLKTHPVAMLCETPVTILQIVIVKAALRSIPVGIGLFPNVGNNLVTLINLLVAFLHTGAGFAGKESWLPDAVVVVVHCSRVTADTSWTRINAKQTPRLHGAPVRVEVHVTQLQNCARSKVCADNTGLEPAIGVDNIDESGEHLGEDVGCQLRDLIHIGPVHKPRPGRVQA